VPQETQASLANAEKEVEEKEKVLSEIVAAKIVVRKEKKKAIEVQAELKSATVKAKADAGIAQRALEKVTKEEQRTARMLESTIKSNQKREEAQEEARLAKTEGGSTSLNFGTLRSCFQCGKASLKVCTGVCAVPLCSKTCMERSGHDHAKVKAVQPCSVYVTDIVQIPKHFQPSIIV
jgi:ribosome-associated translation inhibitor RaiA